MTVLIHVLHVDIANTLNKRGMLMKCEVCGKDAEVIRICGEHVVSICFDCKSEGKCPICDGHD